MCFYQLITLRYLSSIMPSCGVRLTLPFCLARKRMVLEDLGKGLVSQCGTLYGTKVKGTRYLQLTEGYITKMFLDSDNEVCGYEYVHMGKFMEAVKKGMDANEALKSVTGTYGRTKPEQGIVKSIDPRKE